MSIYEFIVIGTIHSLSFYNLLSIIFGTILGIVIGAIPGLTSTMGVALLIPMTFSLPAEASLCMLGAIYCSSTYGGSISAILLRIPGTPASIVTCLDGYELTKKGQAGRALALSTYSSTFGGIFSALCLLLIAPSLAKLSLQFGPPERFLLALFGFIIIINLSGKTLVQGLMSGLFGLVLATTGIEIISGNLRFIYGQTALMEGIPIVPAMIGLVSISQALNIIESEKSSIRIHENQADDRLLPSLDDIKETFVNILRSSIIGTIVGIIPGAGCSIASFIAYSESKRNSKKPSNFGQGSIEGVTASEAANNAVTGGSLVPLLTLGIPGNSVAAVFLGGLLIHGLVPGQELFVKHGVITYTLMMSLIISNIFMFAFGIWGKKYFIKVLKIPPNILSPFIIVLSIIGSYALRNNMTDVIVMFLFGIIGYVMERCNFTYVPIILALVLGPMVERELQRTLLIFQGNLLNFFTRPMCIIFIVLLMLFLYTSLKKFSNIKS